MSQEMKIGGKYNWKGQQERLIYIGYNFSGNRYWHQFEKVGEPGKVWCEALAGELINFEETIEKPVAAQEPIAWHTDAHLTDKSATTYGRDVVERWEAKSWPVAPLYGRAAPCTRCADWGKAWGELNENTGAKITEQAERIKVLEAERDLAWSVNPSKSESLLLQRIKALEVENTNAFAALAIEQKMRLAVEAKLTKADAVIEAAGIALQEVQDLIHESRGIYGMHLNGDESPWNEIKQGGRFERLCTLPDALAAIEQYQKGE